MPAAVKIEALVAMTKALDDRNLDLTRERTTMTDAKFSIKRTIREASMVSSSARTKRSTRERVVNMENQDILATENPLAIATTENQESTIDDMISILRLIHVTSMATSSARKKRVSMERMANMENQEPILDTENLEKVTGRVILVDMAVIVTDPAVARTTMTVRMSVKAAKVESIPPKSMSRHVKNCVKQPGISL